MSQGGAGCTVQSTAHLAFSLTGLWAATSQSTFVPSHLALLSDWFVGSHVTVHVLALTPP